MKFGTKCYTLSLSGRHAECCRCAYEASDGNEYEDTFSSGGPVDGGWLGNQGTEILSIVSGRLHAECPDAHSYVYREFTIASGEQKIIIEAQVWPITTEGTGIFVKVVSGTFQFAIFTQRDVLPPNEHVDYLIRSFGGSAFSVGQDPIDGDKLTIKLHRANPLTAEAQACFFINDELVWEEFNNISAFTSPDRYGLVTGSSGSISEFDNFTCHIGNP